MLNETQPNHIFFIRNNSPDWLHQAKHSSDMDALLAEQMKKHDDKWENNWNYPFSDNFELGKYKAFYSIDEYLKWKDRK